MSNLDCVEVSRHDVPVIVLAAVRNWSGLSITPGSSVPIVKISYAEKSTEHTSTTYKLNTSRVVEALCSRLWGIKDIMSTWSFSQVQNDSLSFLLNRWIWGRRSARCGPGGTLTYLQSQSWPRWDERSESSSTARWGWWCTAGLPRAQRHFCQRARSSWRRLTEHTVVLTQWCCPTVSWWTSSWRTQLQFLGSLRELFARCRTRFRRIARGRATNTPSWWEISVAVWWWTTEHVRTMSVVWRR